MAPLLGFLLTLLWAISHWYGETRYVTSDDAYIQGKITYVSSRKPGRLIALNVNEGDPVKFGEILATIDRTGESYLRDQDTSKDLQSFTAIKRDMAKLRSLEKREIDQKDHYNRAKALLASGFFSPQKLEDLKTEWQQTHVEIAETQKLILAEQQALDISEVHPRNRIVYTPIDGQVAQRLVNLGESVKANQPIVSIINIDNVKNLWIDAFIRETQVWKIKPGQKVQIHVDAWPKDHFTGSVLEFIPAASQAFSLLPTQNAAGTFVKVVQRIPVRIVFDSLKGRTLLPGMSAEVRIDRKTPDAAQKRAH
jgi:membrane fusion protein (multidrug efflux system)